MNKKFFTLIASVLMLVGFVGTASAQRVSLPGNTIPAGKVPSVLENGKRYQIALTTKEFFEDNTLNGGVSTSYANWATTVAGTNAVTAQTIYNGLQGVSASYELPLGSANFTRPLWYAWIDGRGEVKGDAWDAFRGNYFESVFCVGINESGIYGANHTLDISSYTNGYQLLINQDLDVVAPGPGYPAGFTYPTLNAGKGSMGNWGYSFSYGATRQHWMPLYVYDPKDNTQVFIFGADEAAPNSVKAMRWPYQRLIAGDIPDWAILFEFIVPAPRVLNAVEFNTTLGTSQYATSKKLTFSGDGVNTFLPNFVAPATNPDIDENEKTLSAPWYYTALKASDVVPYTPWGGQTAAMTTAGLTNVDLLSPTGMIGSVNKAPWLYFQATEGDKAGKYLYVDTAYYDTANDHLKFNWGTLEDGIAAITNYSLQFNEIKDNGSGTNPRYVVNTERQTGQPKYVSDFINHYRFQATYFWENDSLAIDVAEANEKPNVPDTWNKFYQFGASIWEAPYFDWVDNVPGRPVKIPGTFTTNQAATAAYLGDRYHTGMTNGDRLHVKLRNLDNQMRVLSIGDRPIRTNIQLGAPSCQGVAKASIPEGVYVIRNAENTMWLTVPIYSDTTAAWVSIREAANPHRMPSHQWIVKKSDKQHPDKSPIMLINREFPNVRIYNVALTPDYTIVLPYTDKKNGSPLRFEKVNHKATGSDNSFVPVNADDLKDPFLGYFHIEDYTSTKTYDLNFYNWAFENEDQIYFLNKGTGKDSTLLVNRARTLQFRFVPQDENRARYYGYPVENPATEGPQLRRVAYELVTKVIEDGRAVEKTLIINREHRYALDNYFSGSNSIYNEKPTATFLFKTNNWATNTDKKTTDFFTLLDTTSVSTYLPDNPVPGQTGPKDGTRGGYHDGSATRASDRTALVGLPYDLRFVELDIQVDLRWAYENDQTNRAPSAFAVTEYMPPLYRRFDGGNYTYNSQANAKDEVPEPYAGDNLKDKDSPLFLKFFQVNRPNEFLYENTDKKEGPKNPYRSGLMNKSISFLGIQNVIEFPELLKPTKNGDNVINYEFFVDTAFVKRTYGKLPAWVNNGKSMVFQFRLEYFAGVENPERVFYIESTQQDAGRNAVVIGPVCLSVLTTYLGFVPEPLSLISLNCKE
ncbi:hypothetical protein FACS189438_2490 [Bacteroidia bacterium]|nr:hypothetical protein FACS189438_2490 [Bacteroidia bacterium]